MTKEKDDDWMRKALEEEERVEHGLPADAPTDPTKKSDGQLARPESDGGDAK